MNWRAVFIMLGCVLCAITFSRRAEPATLQADWRYPSGMTINQSRIEYGTCSGAKFGRLKGWQVLPASITLTHFTNVRRVTTCVRAFWFASNGKRYASNVAKVVP